MSSKNSELNGLVSNLEKLIEDFELPNDEELEHTVIDELDQHLREVADENTKIIKILAPKKHLLVKTKQTQIKSIMYQFKDEHRDIKLDKNNNYLRFVLEGEGFKISLID